MTKVEEKTKIRLEYQYAPDFKEYYVTGARGGLMNSYSVHLDFYNEKFRFPTTEYMSVDSEGVGKKIPSEKAPEQIIDRIYVMGVSLSFHAVRELAEWLNGRLKEIDKVEGIERKALKKESEKSGGKA